MASQQAVQLRHRVEAYLGRGLKPNQVRHCEEIVFNFKPWVPLRYVEGLSKTLDVAHRSMRNWGLFYFPLYALAREFRGYTRRNDLVFLRGRLRRIYDQCDLMAGDGFGEKDLSAILFLANECTDKEIHATFTIARTYGLRTLRHLRGIILKNRASAIQPKIQSLKVDDAFRAHVARWAVAKYPEVGMLRQLYNYRAHNMKMVKSNGAYMKWDWDYLNDSKEDQDDSTTAVEYRKG